MFQLTPIDNFNPVIVPCSREASAQNRFYWVR